MYFQNDKTRKVIQYIKEKYQQEPEFLWLKFPNNAVFRHEDNQKWYAVLINLPKRKLGIAEDGEVDILVLKCDPIIIGSLIDHDKYFPAYHMNKEHWITVIIDKINEKEICGMIDLSYEITETGQTRRK
uniref:MmcQ/YjbR family DNA-binding protein n=1 Tax=uncultured Bacillota bacterium TaxID=344338 RepID=A0A650EN73_9FIRM|nr:hypothetical protein Firmicute1046_3050 [uncultured Firmicutes bacterium]